MPQPAGWIRRVRREAREQRTTIGKISSADDAGTGAPSRIPGSVGACTANEGGFVIRSGVMGHVGEELARAAVSG